jgi:hypothetical protein
LRAAAADAAALLAKSVAAFQRNLENDKHWNWTTSETRFLGFRRARRVSLSSSSATTYSVPW